MDDIEKEVVIVTTAIQQLTDANVATAQPLETVPTGVVTLEEVCTKVVEEMRLKGKSCTAGQAKAMVMWVKGFVNRARTAHYATQYPTTRQMRTPEYRIFDAIMPHGQAATEGSAHDLLQRHVLDPRRDEISLLHDRQHDAPGSPEYCTVQVALSVIR